MNQISPEQWRAARRAFDEAMARPPLERDAYLDALDPILRGLVTQLIESDAQLTRTGRLDIAVTPGPDLGAIATGTVIGEFTIERRIGQGGMGIVYLARQQAPDRAVALKLLRADSCAPGRLVRFRMEAEILGRLRHDRVAHVYRAGVAQVAGAAVPYIAMEHVHGKTLREFDANAALTLRGKLALLIEVCRAVHHAHQRGVIHRDLKPSNILVTPDGQPKVVDFGIARLADAAGGRTLQTQPGELLGTLPYMSPEQVAASPDSVDTRSDVYSLGMLAYEWLTGRLPYDVRSLPLADAVARVRRGGAEALRTAADGLPAELRLTLQKALHGDPELRYASMADLADDWERYLAGRAISARAPTVRYQLRVFARTNRAFVTSAAVIAAVVLGAAAVSLAFGVRATRAAERAVREVQRREALNRFFLVDFFGLSSGRVPLGAEATVLASIERAAGAMDQIKDSFQRAAVLAAVSRIYLRFGLSQLDGTSLRERSLAYARESLALRRALAAEEPRYVADSLDTLCSALIELRRFSEAAEAAREALAIRKTHTPDTLEYVETLLWLATALAADDPDGAEPYALAALQVCERLVEPGAPVRRGDALLLLGDIAGAAGRRAEAEPRYRQGLALRAPLREHKPVVLAALLDQLGWLLATQARDAQPEPDMVLFREALDLLSEAKALRGEFLPAGDSALGKSALTIGLCYHWMGEHELALVSISEAAGRYSAAHRGAPHPDVARSVYWRAVALLALEDADNALVESERSLALYAQVGERSGPRVGDAHLLLAELRLRAGDCAAARAELSLGHECHASRLTDATRQALEAQRTRIDAACR